MALFASKRMTIVENLVSAGKNDAVEEIHAYLKKNKDKVLFRESNEDEFSTLMEGYYPLLRNRILFLYKNKHYIK